VIETAVLIHRESRPSSRVDRVAALAAPRFAVDLPMVVLGRGFFSATFDADLPSPQLESQAAVSF
jgi:hypothetical protein